MKRAAKALDFEQAATLRDEIARLKALLPSAGAVQAKRDAYAAANAGSNGRSRR